MVTPDENDVEDLARRILKAARPGARASASATRSTSTRACSRGRRSVRTSRPACSGSSTCSPRARRRRTCSTISTSTSSPTTRPASCAPASASRTRCRSARARGACRGARRHPPHGRQFIGGANPADAMARVADLWNDGYATTVDLLGEKTLTLADADAYAARVRAMLDALAATTPGVAGAAAARTRSVGRAAARATSRSRRARSRRCSRPATADEGIAEALERLGPILDAARAADATIHLDTEHDELKDVTFRLLREIGARYPEGPQLGCVVQAYRVDAARRSRRPHRVVGRHARAPAADPPRQGRVLGRRDDQGQRAGLEVAGVARQGRDRRLVRTRARRCSSPTPATSAPRSRATTRAASRGRSCAAREEGLADDAVEVQVLHGMAEPLHEAVRELGVRTRVYVPVGDLVPGMAYLVRRLLENTSNESFVRHRFTEGWEVDALVAATAARRTARRPAPRAATTDRHRRARPLRQRAARRAAPRRRADARSSTRSRASRSELDFRGAAARRRRRDRHPRPDRLGRSRATTT